MFTNYMLTKSKMREARRIKPKLERATIQIQKEIDLAAEHGQGNVVVETGDFFFAIEERESLTFDLEAAGYKIKWKHCNTEDEKLRISWED